MIPITSSLWHSLSKTSHIISLIQKAFVVTCCWIPSYCVSSLYYLYIMKRNKKERAKDDICPYTTSLLQFVCCFCLYKSTRAPTGYVEMDTASIVRGKIGFRCADLYLEAGLQTFALCIVYFMWLHSLLYQISFF